MREKQKKILKKIEFDIDALIESLDFKYQKEFASIIKNRFVKTINELLHYNTAIIYHKKNQFSIIVAIDKLKDRTNHIWYNPSQYGDYEDCSEDAYNLFLKDIIIMFSNGYEISLEEFLKS